MAIELPEGLRRAAARAIERARSAAPEARWADPAGIHLTVAFLGGVDGALVPRIEDAVERAVRGHRPIPCAMTRLGAFPSERRARVVWAGLEEDGAIGVLASAVQQGLVPTGYEPERRAFRAHVTLARLREPRPVRLPAIEPATGTLESVALFQSHLHPKGARYEVIHRFPLAG
ncbi:MAG TPA: RNA 2',3'-cyclic phosphodiesterase [Actinomycetota bacterium]